MRVEQAARRRLRLVLELPFAERDELDVGRQGDELLVRVGPYRRVVLLPDSLRRRKVAGASLRKGRLRVTFGPGRRPHERRRPGRRRRRRRRGLGTVAVGRRRGAGTRRSGDDDAARSAPAGARLERGVEALQRRREPRMMRAARAVLDAAEGVVDDPRDAAGSSVRGSVADAGRRPRRPRSGRRGPGDDDDPGVQRIPVS